MDDTAACLEELARHLATRRESILEGWRSKSRSDPGQTTANSLTVSQFNDHVPDILDAFEQKLLARPGSQRSDRVDRELHGQEMKHGQQRWQQGYRLPELLREWGHLHLCLARELETIAGEQPHWHTGALLAAQRALIQLIHDGISESADQYARMERADAAGRVKDLTIAIDQLRELEKRRTRLIHQVVHDLRGDVQSVGSVAELLRLQDLPDSERAEISSILQEGVTAIAAMLGDLMDLARLEAGQEILRVAPFDAAALLAEFCRVSQSGARTRKLYLRTEGPAELPVAGDAHKVRRLARNLVHNALKYTKQGGVTVSWGREDHGWWLMVKDTGPGLMGGPGAPLAAGWRDATASAREAETRAAAQEGRESRMLDQAQAGSTNPVPSHSEPGEGIGLSIVKRLCELLEASLELVSSGDSGTTIRVVFPVSYASAPSRIAP
ncbi:MAG TPA: HAMP domain-containing sensor histidine kinase [Lacunisphaera sp.]|nr:HAMP domain-containing sensor histidine kinase [Lacunisphaera sp.]